MRRTRQTVEKFFGWIKEFRIIDTRFDKLASNFMYSSNGMETHPHGLRFDMIRSKHHL